MKIQIQKNVLLILFVGIAQLSYSQNIDSLRQVLKTATIDSIKLELNQEIGNQYHLESKYDSATFFYQEAYSIALKTDNKYKQSLLLSRKATMLYWIAFHTHADSLFKEALNIAIELNDSNLMASSYNSLSSNNLKLEDTLSAIAYMNKALEFCSSQNKTLKGRTYANLGQLKRNLNKLDEALHYFQLSEDIWKELNIIGYIARIQFEKAKIYHLQKKYKKAIHFIRNSLLIDTVNTDKTIQTWKYKRLSDIYVVIGKFDSAYYFQKLHTNTHWEIFTLQRKLAVKELNLKYETEFKEHENSNLKNTNLLQEEAIKNRNILSFISLFVLIIISIILVFLVRGRQKLKEQKDEVLKHSKKLKEANKKLTKLIHFKESLTQMLVHDLKNPLNTLLNLPESLSVTQKADMRNYSAQKMLNLVLNILDVSKYQEAELKIYPKKTSISKLCKRVLVQQEYMIKQKNISVKNKGTHEAYVVADSELTERILSNLLSNALTHTSNNGKISLICEKQDNSFLKISIRDNGQGIPKDKLENVFDKYRQAGSNVKYSTGLGLTFCKAAVEQHGGEIAIESEEGKGTIAWFTLPVSETKFELKTELIAPKKVELSQKEKQELSEFIPIFEKLDLSQITAFRKVFKEIENKYTINETWLQIFKNSVYHCNEEEYNSLIKEIKE